MFSAVFYTSTSTYPRGHISDIDILKVAEFRNAKMSLTGCLVRGPDWFAQSLEGPKDLLFQVFDDIQKDARHSVEDIWWLDKQQERMFPNWRMAMAQVRKNEAHLHDLLRSNDLDAPGKHHVMHDTINRFGRTPTSPM